MLETAALLLALSVGTNPAPAAPVDSQTAVVDTVNQFTEDLVPYVAPVVEPDPVPETPSKPTETKPTKPVETKPWVNPYGQTLGT